MLLVEKMKKKLERQKNNQKLIQFYTEQLLTDISFRERKLGDPSQSVGILIIVAEGAGMCPKLTNSGTEHFKVLQFMPTFSQPCNSGMGLYRFQK